MKNITLSFFLLLFAVNLSFAQELALKVSSKYNDNKSATLSYEKVDPGTHTLVVDFKQLTNTTGAMKQTFTLSGYNGNVITLTPSNKDQSVGISYSYTYIRGKLNPKLDADFVYVLPFRQGAKVRASESGFIGSMYFGKTTPDDWKVYRFYTKEEDTVTAVRKGIVVDVKDVYETATGVVYTNKTNEIIIEHGDGTLATYRGFKKGSVKVKVGQKVFPGTALGLNTTSGSNDAYNISLLLTYLKSADFETVKSPNSKDGKSLYGFITPHFYTAENAESVLTNNQTYTSATNKDVVQKELTKKEIKNLTVN